VDFYSLRELLMYAFKWRDTRSTEETTASYKACSYYHYHYQL